MTADPVLLLTLHGVRLLGFTTPQKIAALYALDPNEVSEHLLDAEAFGWARRTIFGGDQGWSLTDAGRARNEALLAAELDATGARESVVDAHTAFLPLNDRLGPLMTRWQLRPTAADPMAANDHRDAAHDDRVVRGLGRLVADLRPVTAQLTATLPRLGLHQRRLEDALLRVRSLENAWVDSPDLPSLNLVWIQLHEDLLATLGIPRGAEDSSR